MNFSNKTILITGSSDGIGKAIALELAKDNYNLLLLARDKSRLTDVENLCQQNGASSVSTYSVDLTKISEIRNFVEEIKDKSVDGLINCAGIWHKKASLEEIPEDEIQQVINTNLTGLIQLTQKIIPFLRKSEQSFIINISSRSGHSAQKGQSVYSASKFGVRGFTEVLREDFKGTNIRVAGIYQGGTNTQMFNKAGEGFSQEKLSTFIPAEELAKVIAFLASRPNGIWLPEIRIENH